MTKKLRLCSLVAAAIGGCAFAGADDVNLPKVEILGKEYYFYEVKKDDSLYGIAKKFGWDLQELVRLNPTTSNGLKKGNRLYYPTGKVDVSDEKAAEVAAEPTKQEEKKLFEPITHLVKKGETVYSISRQYNVPLETIYASHPSAKQGIKAGETIVINQDASTSASDKKFAYYTIKRGDTLYSLAQAYNVGVADILRANPGVSETNFRAGDTVRIPTGPAAKVVRTETVEEDRLKKVDNYKVEKGDTWQSIAQKTGVPEEQLKEANPVGKLPKKDGVVGVPVIETVEVEKEVEATDPRELTAEGRQEIYDSVNNVDSDQARLTEVRVALLLDDPMGKKDIDFSRGVLLAVDQLKNSPFKIDLKVIDGRQATQNLSDDLEEYEPNMIISTADKNFPAFLADFGNTNHVEIINAFDVKNELYTDNSSMVQFLTPSAYFYEQMADYIADNYGRRKVLMVGTPDADDGIAELLNSKLNSPEVISVEELPNYNFTDGDSYLIYAYPTKREEVADLVAKTTAAFDKVSTANFTVVGRPNWITLSESMGKKFGNAHVIIPARFYYNPESGAGRSFTADFQSAYGGAPVKSFPNYAAVGYDIANYFIPYMSATGGDFNRSVRQPQHPVQSDIELKRVSNWGGFFNPRGYILSFGQGGDIDKIDVR